MSLGTRRRVYTRMCQPHPKLCQQASLLVQPAIAFADALKVLVNVGPECVFVGFVGRGFDHLGESEDQRCGNLAQGHCLYLHLAIDQREDSLVKDLPIPHDFCLVAASGVDVPARQSRAHHSNSNALTAARPGASLAPIRWASFNLAPRRSASFNLPPIRWALFSSAHIRLAPFSLALLSLAPFSLALLRSALLSSAQIRLAPFSKAPRRSALQRLALPWCDEPAGSTKGAAV